MSVSKQLLPLRKKKSAPKPSDCDTYYIPVYASQDRIAPWKPGEQQALAQGISARKHRETADVLWLARRRNDPHLAALEQVYAPPEQDPLYEKMMQAIRSHQNRQMLLLLPLGVKYTSLSSFSAANPRQDYVASFVREELVEKGWRSAELLCREGDIYLCVDFRL